MMAVLLTGIRYMKNEYLLYAIRRDDVDVNLFISKLVRTSDGCTISHEFSNGEREGMEDVVKKFINKYPITSLESDGYTFFKDFELEGVNYFDSKACYVATISKKLLKMCLIFYHLVDEKIFSIPTLEVLDDKRKVNDGFVGNLFVIIFGVFVLLFCISVVGGIILGR